MAETMSFFIFLMLFSDVFFFKKRIYEVTYLTSFLKQMLRWLESLHMP